jgi:FkbM family methyltransferase
MPSFANWFTANPIGRYVFRTAIQPAVHAYRRRANPDVPSDQLIAKYNWQGRELVLHHFRHGSGTDGLTQCFEQRQYDFPIGVHGKLIQRRYDEIVASGAQPLIVDCGANIGTSVMWFGLRYPKAHIVAIEPAPDNFGLLKVNTAGFDVDLRQAGVAPADGTARLDASHGTDMGYRTSDDAAGPAIDMVSIATILAQKDPAKYKPFLLKIDIEGAEKPLFAGDTTAINQFPLIILEPHDWLIPGQRSSVEFFRFHAAAGREFCMKDENIASIAWDKSLTEATEGFTNAY